MSVRSTKRAVIAAAAGVAAAVGAVALTAQPAAASPHDGNIWIFKDWNYQADADWWPGWAGGQNDLSTRWYYYGGSYENDSISSIANETNQWWCFFRDWNYGGGLLVKLAPYSATAYVGDWANDQISSLRVCTDNEISGGGSG